MSKIKVLITGSNGLVGQKLVEVLTTNPECEVIATSLSSNRIDIEGEYKFELLDITVKSQVDYMLSLYQPDIVINSAAISQVDFCEENKSNAWNINVLGTHNLVDAVNKIDSKLIQISTDFVFDGNKGMYIEEDNVNPVSYYGQTKLEAEKYVSDMSKDWAIVRTVLVYGLNYNIGRNNILTWVIDSLKDNKAIKVVNDQFRTPTLDIDLAKGIEQIIKHNKDGIYHISGKEYLSVYEFAQLIASVFGYDVSLISPISSISLNQTGRRPPKTGFNITKAMKELEYFPLDIKEGLQYCKSLLPDN